MSRLIVKNLPNGMKEERFSSMFAAFGTVTDCSLKFTKDGKFRKFGFVGFKSEEDASRALKHFNKSFVDTSRVTVEICKAFGDPTKGKAWSKHTQSAKKNEKKDTAIGLGNVSKQHRFSDVFIPYFIPQLEEDQEFKEFLSVHQNRSQAPTWANDAVQGAADPESGPAKSKKKKKSASDDYLNFDSDQSEDEDRSLDDDDDDDHNDDDNNEAGAKEALKSGLSDMDYLRSKMAPIEDTKDEDEDNDDDSEVNDETDYLTPLLLFLFVYICFCYSQMEPATEFTVKLRGVPFSVKEQQIKEFMTPLRPAAIRIGKNESGQRTGYVYVDLHSEEEVNKALKKNKDYIGEMFLLNVKYFQLLVCVYIELEDEEEEDVSETGRLFVRNLPYTCTEEDIRELFSKHGPLSEVLFPIDNLTKKPKGFAFVTYMIPENAVTALAQLDRHVFQGRMLHLLPSTVKKENPESSDAGGPGSSSYKRQKDAKNKASSSSSHNWNTLFLGTNAVADAIAEKYNTTKSQVLDHESKGSLAVRMALGETQIVQETRQFLLENSVSLDSFSQAAAARSTTVILVKNLPAGVTTSELEELFSPHGSLGRVLLPPSGLTAIIEFLEPTEAKRAFTRLAYSKFHHVPLYLEWAPVGVFVADQQKTGKLLSMGYGFVQYQSAEGAQKALRQLQHCCVDDHKLELKISDKTSRKKKQAEKKQTGSKILVRNVPFQATVREIRELFCTFGELKTVRLPKKAAGSGNHRGFGFVDFITKQDAKKAFAALCHSTHLYGRRLVLEWADAEETVEALRRKTAEHYHGMSAKKSRQSKVLEGIMETMETEGRTEN
uniref:Probable RNA-binding protein 19 n=1 Tax=Oryzias sinensis TaxID=183150 RepID=A0A8C7ZC57_9TELE